MLDCQLDWLKNDALKKERQKERRRSALQFAKLERDLERNTFILEERYRERNTFISEFLKLCKNGYF